MAGNNNAALKLIAAFAAVIIGIGLLTTVSSEILTKTDKDVSKNEVINIATARMTANDINDTTSNFSVTNAPTSWKQQDCPLTGISLRNASTLFTEDTDYVVYEATGVVRIVNTTATKTSLPNLTYINYTYCPDDYMSQGWGRTALTTVPGLFAIALLLIGVGLFYSVAKEYGIINW